MPSHDFIDLNETEFSSDDYINFQSVVLKDQESLPDLKVVGSHVYKLTFSGEINLLI